MNHYYSLLPLSVMLLLLLTACSNSSDFRRLPDGSEYRGELRDGLLHDRGEISWPNGDHYQGEFFAGKVQGKGVLTRANGDRLSGHFVDGVLQGFGEHENADGDIYRGEFKDGEYHGLGEEVMSYGMRRQGLFLYGLPSGMGVYQWDDGEAYIGNFTGGYFHGFGHYRGEEGHYTGDFTYGYFHGEGHYVYADGREEKGYWQRGHFVGEEPNEREQLEVALKVERAFLQQDLLLEEQLNQLSEGDPDKVELYLLTMALDGEQSVFAREITTINQVMDQRFATKTRRLSLSNHPDTLSQWPMASLTSVPKAMQAIAKKMDKQQDILFVYLTTHGSEDHQLSVQAPGMDLHDLPADYLGELVHALPVKWKVIVVSSCFSGGFIPHLEAPEHLVITAARHDRTSFGCSDDSDMTYFGRAFFSEALPQAESFQAAFAAALEQVTAWETEDDYTHSEPQMRVGEEINQYLQQWLDSDG